MTTKIKSVTVVCQHGARTYKVGSELNGLTIQRIDDYSIEFPEEYHSIYMGFTAEDERVFEVINAPVSVEYERAEA